MSLKKALRALLAVFLLTTAGALAKPPPPAPLTGTVTTGSVTSYDQSFPGIALQSGKPFHFSVLPPAQYSTTYAYPLLIWLHPNDEGNDWYNGSEASDPGYLIDGYGDAADYNTVPFRTAYPAFIVAPSADQTGDTGGATENWGGWTNTGVTGSGTVYSGDTGPNVFALLDMVTYLESIWSIDPSRIYPVGWSLGAIGTEYLMLKYNVVNGNPKVFAAGYTISGGMAINGGSPPVGGQITSLTNVPEWNFNGPNDSNDPDNWDTTLCTAYSGSSTYAAPQASAAASRCGTSQHYLWWCPTCGDQNTDANGNNLVANTTVMNWLFSQSASAADPSGFTISGGQIIGPNGQPWIAKGINTGAGLSFAQYMSDYCPNSSCSGLLNTFPGVNFIRFAVPGLNNGGYPSPSTFTQFVQWLQALGIVIEFEDHDTNDNVYTGTELSNETAWYQSMAAAYPTSTYPDVWWGTMNEPGPNDSPQEVAIYNAIRGTGNTSPILMSLTGGGNPGTVGAGCANGLVASDYATMTNIIWALHYYNWVSGYSTNQTVVNADLQGSAASCSGVVGAQTITSANGVVPVLIEEYGVGAPDPGGYNVVTAVTTSGLSSAAWAWWGGGTDNLLLSSPYTGGASELTTYGQQVAAYIAQGAPTPPPPSGAVTWNVASASASITISGNELVATSTAATPGSTLASVGYTTGAHCFGVVANTITTDWAVGLANGSFGLGNAGGIGADTNAIGFYAFQPPQSIWYGGVQLTEGSTADASGDEVDECFNLATDMLWVSTPVMRAASTPWNNSNTANPATGTGGMSFSGMTCPCYAIFNTLDNGSVGTLNATGPLAVSLPAGFSYYQPATTVIHHASTFNLGLNEPPPWLH